MKTIKVIGFDADDTLWVNEPYYQEVEHAFCKLLKDFLPPEKVSEALLQTEITNLKMYGYGAKGFMLSLIETAIKVSEGKVSSGTIGEIIIWGKSLLEKPIVLLEDVEKVLSQLKNRYQLILATKGDLIDQERKLKSSALLHYFHHIEIMSDKKEIDYQRMFNNLEIQPDEFLMVGNSMKSDILPVISLGSYAVHVPYHTTWQQEKVNEMPKTNERFYKINNLGGLLKILSE